MFIVQLGHFAWLSDVCPVTTSGAHAKRFPTEGAALSAVRSFTADRRGNLAHMLPGQRQYYATLEPTVIPAAELDARLAESAKAQPAPKPEGEAQPARRQSGGVTKAIFEWTRAHPESTKADALAAFPDANRSTVSVQFSAARREG